jgi:hypothetical protein
VASFDKLNVFSEEPTNRNLLYGGTKSSRKIVKKVDSMLNGVGFKWIINIHVKRFTTALYARVYHNFTVADKSNIMLFCRNPLGPLK